MTRAVGKRLPNGAWLPAGQEGISGSVLDEQIVAMNNGRARVRADGSSFFIAFCQACDHEHEIDFPCTPDEAKARVSAGLYSLGHPVLPCPEHKKAP